MFECQCRVLQHDETLPLRQSEILPVLLILLGLAPVNMIADVGFYEGIVTISGKSSLGMDQ